MEWIIVHFLLDNVVEAVPVAWVFDDICYWPPYKGSKLRQAISSCKSPIFGEWNICKVRQLANGQKYDNLLKAKEKCTKAEYTSDLNSDLEAKREIKKKRFFGEKSSDDDIAHFDSDPTLRHNIPFKKQALTQKSHTLNSDISESSSDFSEHDILSNQTLPSSPSKIGIKSLQSITLTNKSMGESTLERHNQKENELPTIFTCNKSLSQNSTSCDNLSDNNFKKQVLRQLQIINLRQQQITEDLSVLLMKATSEKNEPTVSNEDSIFKNYNFPLKEIQELEMLEEFLIQDNNFKNFIKELMQIGGASYKHMVKRVLTRIMSNNLSKTYSWIGFKGKRNFSNLRICSAIVTATQNTHGCSEAMIETIIKYWLVKSTEREKQVKKIHEIVHSK